MKFKIGDCLAIRTADENYLAVIVTSLMENNYQLSLAEYRDATPPPMGFFRECRVYIRKHHTGEATILALEVLSVDAKQIDQRDDIILMDRVEVGAAMNSAVFSPFEDVSLLSSFYATLMADVHGEKHGSIPRFDFRSVLSLNEFLKSIPEPNEFPTVKLYKEIEGITHYWQIYGSSMKKKFLVIGHGKLGESGEYVEISDLDLLGLRHTYRREIARKIKEGYRELEGLHSMILQFQANDTWGNTNDLDFRNEVWDYLDGFLFWTGNGNISGGDIGSGTINLFIEVVEPSLAVNTILHALEEKEIRHPFVIAQQDTAAELSNSFVVKVLYPKDFKGEFCY